MSMVTVSSVVTQEEKADFFLFRYMMKLAATTTLNITIMVMQTQSTVDDIPAAGAGFSPPFVLLLFSAFVSLMRSSTVFSSDACEMRQMNSPASVC